MIEIRRVRPRTLDKYRAHFVCAQGHDTFSAPVVNGDTARAVARVQREIDDGYQCGVISCSTREVTA